MTALKALLTIAVFSILLLGGIMAYNWTNDPQCFYNCREISLNKRTLNTYYIVAQKAVAHPEAELIMLGSSRGETTPPALLKEIFGLPSVNLSVAGADFISKKGFAELAMRSGNVKKIVWLADFFEMLPDRTDVKMLQVQALYELTGSSVAKRNIIGTVKSLIDHNTFEATLAYQNRFSRTAKVEFDLGAGTEFSVSACDRPQESNKQADLVLAKEVDLIFQNYATSVLRGDQKSEYLQNFKAFVDSTTKQGVSWVIWIAPYHPVFKKKLQMQYPAIWQAHLKWIDFLKSLQRKGEVSVLDFQQSEIPFKDNASFWGDGVHFKCTAVRSMLQGSLSK